MPDPEFVRKQKTVEKVNMVYGTDKCPITLYRPVDAYFTVAPGSALNARDRVWLRADDSSWSAEVFGVVCFENGERISLDDPDVCMIIESIKSEKQGENVT